MEYGLRYYETSQRLWWFALMLFCLALAYPVAKSYVASCSLLPPLKIESLPPELLKSSSFWTKKRWICENSLGFAIVYLAWTGVFFWIGKLAWLAVQWTGKVLVSRVLINALEDLPKQTKLANTRLMITGDKIVSLDKLRQAIDPLVMRLLFNPFKRLHVLLSEITGVPASDVLVQRENRLETVDWELVRSSWGAYRWLIRLLPLLAVVQASWLFYLHIGPVISGKTELQAIPGIVVVSLLPVVQVAILTAILCLAQGFVERLEIYYLTRLDALFYDRLLSRLPLQSQDTLLLLHAIKKHFDELNGILRNIQQKLESSQRPRR